MAFIRLPQQRPAPLAPRLTPLAAPSPHPPTHSPAEFHVLEADGSKARDARKLAALRRVLDVYCDEAGDLAGE
jgi:hypothetical protein